MLKILPITVCYAALLKNVAHYALINAQYLPIMLKLCSMFYSSIPLLC